VAGTQELPPIHPNRVMARAILTGLSTTVELMRIIKTQETQHQYELSKKKLKEVKKAYDASKKTRKPDFSPITKAEPSIRENFLAMLSEKASKFGNIEVVRVYDPRDTIRRLNQGYNRAGGVIRNFNACWYDFPNTEQFGYRKGKDGRKIRITGYFGPSTGKVQTKHCDNPSLDFGDVNREHLRLLNTWSFIYQVPLNDAHAYFRLFYLRVKPYMDYIYSERRSGLPGFEKGAWELLSNLKQEMGALYPVRNGEESFVTRRIVFPTSKYTVSFIKTSLKKSSNVTEEDKDWTLKLINEGIIRNRDVTRISQTVQQITRKRGSREHENFQKCFSGSRDINDIILSGDEMTDNPEFILVSELNLNTEFGKGRLDLGLFARVSSLDRRSTHHRPVMAIEIKTSSGSNYSIEEVEVETEVIDEKEWISHPETRR
jgi:hypothetical protein